MKTCYRRCGSDIGRYLGRYLAVVSFVNTIESTVAPSDFAEHDITQLHAKALEELVQHLIRFRAQSSASFKDFSFGRHCQGKLRRLFPLR